ncbi:hypothetical protein AWB70_07508 [Caballeronia cordobensis]|uniref:Uncharacterized protein n=1 Tax=Caballeronia cordobensis TaxID=1353886 RepID=A0A158JV64_CABCO|nr:hypothetical protein AWB70_07508 [Caballeronia cordobensis]
MERFVHRPDNEAIGKDDTRGFGPRTDAASRSNKLVTIPRLDT